MRHEAPVPTSKHFQREFWNKNVREHDGMNKNTSANARDFVCVDSFRNRGNWTYSKIDVFSTGQILHDRSKFMNNIKL